jgi:SAM-dependent methyltransferase
MEIGAGDCALSLSLAGRVRRVYAVDVSDKVLGDTVQPPNFTFALSDGCSMPVPPGSVGVAYSNQLMEHLHPDDAELQLVNIFNALAPRGAYACITPNRLSGPHDISCFFDDVATGFHLKEYTTTELAALFRRIGFRKVAVYASLKGRYFRVPLFAVTVLEGCLSRLSPRWRRRVAASHIVRSLLGVQLVGVK